MIRRFKEVTGKCAECIPGQRRLAYSLSDTEDFYDMPAWLARGGYQGSVLRFHDYETGGVYEPFAKCRNVVYGAPLFHEGAYYFLRGDFNSKMITLYRYFPEAAPEMMMELPVSEVDLYNLQLAGEGVHIISQGDVFRCYYPETFSFALQPNETVCLITEDRVYAEAWIEEGWDQENDRAADDYNFYNKIVVKDYAGNTVSEETGSLHQAADGTWWIA